MPKLPRARSKELVAALARVRFQVIRLRGSHHFGRHDDGRAAVVPGHSGETIGAGLLNEIRRDREVNTDDLSALL